MLLIAGYAVAITYGSLVPLDYRPVPLAEAAERFKHMPNYTLDVSNRADWLANLLLYIPIGFMPVLAAGRCGRGLARRIVAAIAAAGFGACLAVAVEFAQIWFPPRTVSQNDLRAEVIGTCIGASLALVVGGMKPIEGWRREAPLRLVRDRWGVVYIVALVAYATLPLDLVVSREEFLSKFEAGRVTLAPWSGLVLTWAGVLKHGLHAACFAPIGYLAAAGCQRDGLAKSTVAVLCWSAGAGLLLAAGIEVLQLPIYSRHTATSALGIAAIGAAAGGMLHLVVRRSSQRPVWLARMMDASRSVAFWKAAVWLYCACIVVILLAPFEPVESSHLRTERWDRLFRVPFAAQHVSSEFDAFTNILQKGLIFAILGALLRQVQLSSSIAARRCKRSPVRAIVISAFLGSWVEIGQVFFAAHEPDMTDILIYTFFGGIGFAAFDLIAAPRVASYSTICSSTQSSACQD